MNACMFTWCRPVHCSWCQPRDPISAERWRASRGNRPRGVRSNPHYPDDSHHTLYSPDSTKPPPTASRGETEDERLLWCSEEWNSLNTIKERRERERDRQRADSSAQSWLLMCEVSGALKTNPAPSLLFTFYTRRLRRHCACVCVCESARSSSVEATL